MLIAFAPSTSSDTMHQQDGTYDIAFDGTLRRINVPILMYHYVSELPEDADVYRRDLTVEPAIFREHLNFLLANEYTSISLYDLHGALNHGHELPTNPIILTFDDGYSDHYTNVLPMMNEFDFIGTFFVITNRLDNADPSYITWQQAQEMQSNGMDIESHTKSHPDLRQRTYDFLIFEILGSVESITANIGETSRIFSYPAGRYDNDTLQLLNSTSILLATTTRHGRLHTTTAPFELRRLRVSGNIGVNGLRQLLE